MGKINKLDIVALFISFCALGLSLHQAIETEKSNSVSVHPHLDMTIIGGYGTKQEKGIKIDNSGTGPAIIDDFNLYVDGIKVKGDKNYLWSNALKQLGYPHEKIMGYRMVYLAKTTTLRAGREFYLITPNLLGEGKPRTLTDNEWNDFHRISIRIDYHGAFGDKCYVLYTPSNPSLPFERTSCFKT